MNIYIMVDMEGISGIFHMEQVLPGAIRYESEGRRYATWDVNACIEGLKEAGVDNIIVRDSHGGGKNLLWEELSPEAEYIYGGPGDRRMPFLDECDGLILLGYHAMAGTPKALLEHTISSKGWQNFWLNDTLAGEVAIDAGIAGDFGVPVIMVSGDDKVCSEARGFLPDVVTAEVKKGLGLYSAKMIPKETAHKLIYEKSKNAVENLQYMKPYRLEKPITMKLEKMERNILPSTTAKPYVKIIDGRTFEVSGNTVEEALNRLMR